MRLIRIDFLQKCLDLCRAYPVMTPLQHCGQHHGLKHKAQCSRRLGLEGRPCAQCGEYHRQPLQKQVLQQDAQLEFLSQGLDFNVDTAVSYHAIRFQIFQRRVTRSAQMAGRLR